MRFIFLVALLIAGIAHADESDLSKLHQSCTNMSIFGRNMMIERQNGELMSDTVDILERVYAKESEERRSIELPILKKFAILIYKVPIAPTEELKEWAANEAANAIYSGCISE